MNKKILLAAVIVSLALCLQACEEPLSSADSALMQATAVQRDWLGMKYGMFIHFGPNTYQMKAWGNGTYPAANLNFSNVDVAQWAQTAQAAGMKYAVLTAKHHDGFCLWPTSYSTYCVTSTQSPTVDVVGLFVNEFRKAGLKVGIYYSLWDRNNPTYYDADDTEYVTYMKNQLTELLTNYGEISELWFDGAWDRDYPHACQDPTLMALIGQPVLPINDPNNQHALCWLYNPAYETLSPNSIHGQRWSWDEIYALVHRLQPNCQVINNSSENWKGGLKYMPVDIRTVEQFDLVLPSVVTIYDDMTKYLQADAGGKQVYLPLEFCTTLSPNWFWTGDVLYHPSVEEIVGWFRTAQTYHGNLLLNVGPGMDGRIPAYNVDYLTRAKDILFKAGDLR